METLQINKDAAVKAHQNAKDSGKRLLEDLLGKKTFQLIVTDRVKTFEDACAELGLQVPSFIDSDSNDGKSIIAYQKLITIARALNEGWEPDFTNSSESKYYPWFQYKSGFGFSFSDWSYSTTYSSVGARLCFKTKELAIYAGKQFEAIYRDYLTL